MIQDILSNPPFPRLVASASFAAFGLAASATASLTAIAVEPGRIERDGRVHFVYTLSAEFSSPLDTVLNIYGVAARPAGSHAHRDFLAGDGSGGGGTWSPSLVAASDVEVDSWCTIGGTAGSFANLTASEPGWGPLGWNQPGMPALAGWFNPNPPNLQGRVDPVTRRTVIARFVFRDAVEPFTTPVTVGFNQGLGTPAQFGTVSVTVAADGDGDGVPDPFDNCPGLVNADQADGDGDGVGDSCDNCPDAGNATQSDDDLDGAGDACDECPLDAQKVAAGQCGCGVADTDSDGDGTADCNDGCPGDASKVAVGQCGCGVADTDSDGDGTADCNDGCPGDANKVAAGQCGCGVADTDSDGDGTADCNDGCPSDANKTTPGECGCGRPDLDRNENGVADCLEDDSDGDGVPDETDRCPNDASKSFPGLCGCGVPDTDSDGDGIVDCLVIASVPQLGLLPAAGVLAGDDFGGAIALDGSFAVVGLPLDDITGKTNAGTARVFQWNGSSWVQAAELLAPSADSKANDAFGTSVAIHGDVVVVGAPASDLGAVTDAAVRRGATRRS
jgi:hypothetical protein